MKILKYEVVTSPVRDELVEAVNKLLKEGWELRGELVPDAKFWVQVMVLVDRSESYERKE